MRTFAARFLTGVISVVVFALSACSERASDRAPESVNAPAEGGASRAAGASAESAAGGAPAMTRAPLDLAVIAVGIVKSQVGAEVKVGSQLSGIVARLHVN